MFGRHVTLVAPEQMHLSPWNAIAPWLLRISKIRIEAPGRPASGQRDEDAAAGDRRLDDELRDAFGRKARELDLVVCDGQLRHRRSSRSISTSASAGPMLPAG